MNVEETIELTEKDKGVKVNPLLDEPEPDDVAVLDDLPEFVLDEEEEEDENISLVDKLEIDAPDVEPDNTALSEDEDEDMPIMPIVEMDDEDSAEKDTAEDVDPLVGEENEDLNESPGLFLEESEIKSPTQEPANCEEEVSDAEDKNKSNDEEDIPTQVMNLETDKEENVNPLSEENGNPLAEQNGNPLAEENGNPLAEENGNVLYSKEVTNPVDQPVKDVSEIDEDKNMADVEEVMSALVMDLEEANSPQTARNKDTIPLLNEQDDDVIALDQLANDTAEAKDDNDLSDDEDDMPMIRMKSDIFEAPNDDDDDEEDDNDMDPVDIHSMMQVEMGEDSDEASSPSKPAQKKRKAFTEETPVMRRTPRRAAAQAAANTIKEITNMEQQDGPPTASSDPAYRAAAVRRNSSSTTSVSTSGSGSQTKPISSISDSEKHRCHQCKAINQSLIVVRQYGTDIHLCSNACFNSFRNPDPIFRPLPCAKCGTLNRDNENGKLYFWETMNFCSDLCVGNFQLQIGAACSTCSRKTPWTCMGKYCVRFGSDVRQFCTASCLESYKKSARVCFHCQLDIKRLGNVVLANIPSKAATKEFCSQDCVEMYIDQNLRQGTGSQKASGSFTCSACKQSKTVFKELVTPVSNHKVCSSSCWDKVLYSQNISTATKCETCTKYINMDTISISPSYYVATEKRAHGFCSATCKNVFVLKSRQILSCTTCKVKKYNYDLIQFVTGRVTNYAVCSLNCLPKPSQYILNLKDTLNPATSASQMTKGRVRQVQLNEDGASVTVPTITSVVGNANQNKGLPNGEANQNGFNASGMLNGDGGYEYGANEAADVTVRQIRDEDIIEIRDDDVITIDDTADLSQNQIVPQAEDDVPLDDERWAECETIVIIRPPQPVQRRNKACMATTIVDTEDKEVQTDSEELWAMPRVEMKLPEPEEKVRYVPVPIPYPVLMPYPCYALSRPIPVPFPVGIPVPIPIPLDMSLFTSNNGLTFNDIPVPIEADGAPSITATDTDDVEMMDTSESCDVPASSYLNIFNFTNSPMSVGSPTAPASASGVAPGSPLGVKARLSRADQGIRAWKIYFPDDDPLNSPSAEFSEKLVNFVLRATKPKDRCRIEPDVLLNYVLGIQQYLKNGGRTDSIFYDTVYSPFVKAMTSYAEEEASRGRTIARVDEENVWDSMELGAGSPGILLFTLIYHIYKHFNLKTWQEHAALEFSQIHIDEKTSESGETIKYVSIEGLKNAEDELIEVPERTDAQLKLRCPVNLFEFYKSKCETTDGTFYKAMISNEAQGSTWYNTESLNQFDLYHMLVRAMMIHFESID